MSSHTNRVVSGFMLFHILLLSDAIAESPPSQSAENLAVITGHQVQFRVGPSSSALVIGTFRRAFWVTAANEVRESDDGSWRKVVVRLCGQISPCIPRTTTGWVEERYVALTKNFDKINKWKESTLSGLNVGDLMLSFHLHADGTVTECSGEAGGVAKCSSGLMLKKDRLMLFRFKAQGGYPAYDGTYYYYVLALNEDGNLCTIDEDMLGHSMNHPACTTSP